LNATTIGDVLIWGAGGHGRVVADIFRLHGETLLGFVEDVNPARKGEIFEDAQTLGGREVLIASTACIGEGVMLCANAVVGPGGRVGDFAIVDTAGVVDDDCVLEEAGHLSAGVHMGGGARVGRASLVGIGGTLLDRGVAGNRTIVGAGSVVVRDQPDEVVVSGVPARVERSRT
jgi:UDP-N-acetylbacillosamine N-acetyltransferase